MPKTPHYFCIACSENKENCKHDLERSSLFKFPSTPERKLRWISKLNLENIRIPLRARVCENHFHKGQFVRTRLRKDAIPQMTCEDSNAHNAKKRLEDSAIQSSKPDSDVYILPRPMDCHTKVTSIMMPPPVVVAVQPQIIADSQDCQQMSNAFPPVLSHRKCMNRISALNSKLEEITNNSVKKLEIEKIFGENPGFLKIIQAQILRYADKSVPYTTFEKTLGLSLYYSCGRSGYRTLMSLGLKLPAFSSIRRWMTEFKFSTGINQQVFEILKNLFRDKSMKEKDCVLVWDEMSIKEFLEFNKSLDMFEGLVDFGQQGRKLETANEVLVFMVQGINSKWKYPISYYFTSNATTSEMLNTLVKENLTEVFKAGLVVRMGICDMSFTNQGLYRSWGITPETPYIIFEGHEVICVHDTPHLIKLVRNNLMKHDFLVGGAKIKWSHVVSFFRKDRRTVSRMAPKLTNSHIFLKDFSKMKVKLAAQVLSFSVYAGISAMCRIKILKKDAKATAMFIKEVDGIFDLLNISSFSKDKPSRCGRNLFQNLGKFDNYIQYIKSVSIPTTNREPEFIKGLLLNLAGIKKLVCELISEGYSCVYTRRLQQDCLENFFSAVRMKGGFCRNPTARTFRLHFRYLFFSMVMINPGSGNTEELTTNFFKRFAKFEDALPLNNTKPKSKPKNISENSLQVKMLDSSAFYGFKANRKLKLGDVQEETVAEYFGAACIKSFTKRSSCSECKKMLVTCQSSSTATSVRTALTVEKMFEPNSNLKVLRPDISLIFKFMNKMFPTFTLQTLTERGTCVTARIFECYSQADELKAWFHNDKCLEHRIYILSYFIRAKVFKIVQDKNDNLRKVKSWDQSRRDLRNQ